MSSGVSDIEYVFIYLIGWVGSVVCTLGLLGNIFTLLVLTKKDFRQINSTLYLIALSVYDTAFLATNLMVVSFDWVAYGLDPYNEFNLRFTTPASVVLDPILALLICASVYTTVALTVDRSIAVAKPLTWPSICTRRRVKVTITAVLLWSAAYTIPFCLEYTYTDVFIADLNDTFLLSTNTDYSSSLFHTEIFLKYIVPIVTMGIPIITITIPNIIIIVVLRRQQRNMETSRSSSARSSRSNRLTAQVLFISGFTLLSRIFHSVSFILMDDNYYVNECSFSCACITATSALLVNINAAINFICYCSFGEKFRSAFVQTVCACFGRKDSQRKGTQRVFTTTTKMSDEDSCTFGTPKHQAATSRPD